MRFVGFGFIQRKTNIISRLLQHRQKSSAFHLVLVRKTHGFTLIELIVSMAIMAMLSLAFLTQSEATVRRQKHESFIAGVEEILGELRSARTAAISSRPFGLDDDGVPVAPEGGFGVNLAINASDNTLTVTEFVDDSDGIDPVPDEKYTAGSDSEISKTVKKAHWATRVRAQYPTPGISDNYNLTVLFVAPDATMIINDNNGTDMKSAELFFRYENITRLICLNRVSRFVEAISGDSC